MFFLSSACKDEAIISKDLNGVITSWNRGAERLYGYTAEQIIGRPISLLLPPEQPDELPGILERLKRGEAGVRIARERFDYDVLARQLRERLAALGTAPA